ncbi:ATP-binding cassette domain-containing protein [Methanoregula sp.]|uniref:ABC transporter ATP-binding protein n=1 Tax=Methanoregula sp. TaxID=2052170 RepID=UPI00236C1EF2|nr:ATP-binding cassette domain-containing protein [Methanoregula sp.]MDD1685789.1 ATP-binding cassette domain-containing protein [Methanoregula sp.]
MDNHSLSGQDTAPFLEFDNVTVFHGDKKVLDGLSVTLRRGGNVAILGPNGAGKSSFIKTITREFYPRLDAGPVMFRICGKDVWDVFALRSAFGVVSNDLQYTFTRQITGREVVLSGFFSSIGLFNREITPEMDRKADEICAFLGVSGISDRTMTEMSSGESRRFLIGRAMVNDPGVLILDEPTNSLDLNALHTFRQTIRKIARAGTGIILVTHNLQDIIPEIDRVILMKNGRFEADGRKEDLLTDDHIGRLFGVPMKVITVDGYYYATGY